MNAIRPTGPHAPGDAGIHVRTAMLVVKSLAPWIPWIAFLIIAQGSMARLRAGLVVALVLGIVLAALKLFRGVLMWAALLFFAGALITVFGLHNTWVLKHLGVIANVMPATGAWGSLAVGKPFTLDYARAHTDPSKWNDPVFLRVNRVITLAWAVVFTVNAALAWAMTRHVVPMPIGLALTFAALIGASVFSSWYPQRVRRAAVSNAAVAVVVDDNDNASKR